MSLSHQGESKNNSKTIYFTKDLKLIYIIVNSMIKIFAIQIQITISYLQIRISKNNNKEHKKILVKLCDYNFFFLINVKNT